MAFQSDRDLVLHGGPEFLESCRRAIAKLRARNPQSAADDPRDLAYCVAGLFCAALRPLVEELAVAGGHDVQGSLRSLLGLAIDAHIVEVRAPEGNA